jgi:hypothetical protein
LKLPDSKSSEKKVVPLDGAVETWPLKEYFPESATCWADEEVGSRK